MLFETPGPCVCVCAFVVSHWQCWCASLEHPPVTHPDWLFIKSGTTVSCVRSCLGFFSRGGEAAPLIHTDGRWIEQGFSRHAETYRPIYYSCRNRKASNTAWINEKMWSTNSYGPPLCPWILWNWVWKAWKAYAKSACPAKWTCNERARLNKLAACDRCAVSRICWTSTPQFTAVVFTSMLIGHENNFRALQTSTLPGSWDSSGLYQLKLCSHLKQPACVEAIWLETRKRK